MKKILSLGFILSLVFALTACGGTIQKETIEEEMEQINDLDRGEKHDWY